MKVKIIRVIDKAVVDANIIQPGKLPLPSLTEGWRFNFKKHSKRKGFITYVLVGEDSPGKIEGCLIFQMKNTVEPYMAFIEVAPHNRGKNKVFDRVAGCLIAFACRLSFIHGKDDYQGWLAFDVLEGSKEDEIRLMAIYCKKYGALKYGDTTMVIPPDAGEQLIGDFLK